MKDEVHGDHSVQDEVLEDLREAVRYREWIVDELAPHLGAAPIEIGSGTGDYAAAWADRGCRIVASEASSARLAALDERFADDPRVTVRRLSIPITEEGKHTAAVAVNVLEHVADDVACLRSLASLVAPGGAVVLLVPAMPWAMSRFDRQIGHHRRYTLASLRESAGDAGLDVERCTYFNSVGLFGWLVVCTLLGGRPSAGPLLRVYDGVAVPFLRWAESRFGPPPFGQSVIMVARRPPAT